MGKQTNPRKPENVFGKGKVTPLQVAFIVDRYLSDNNYTQTRSTFRTEASHLIPKSPVQEAPKGLLSLGAMLEEYICLKEQRVMVDQEKWRIEQEKFRVQTLLRGMQDVMSAYSAGGASAAAPPPPMVSSVVVKPATMAPQIELTDGSPAGYYPPYNTPIVMSTSMPSNTPTDSINFSTPTTIHPTSKRRKDSTDISDTPATSKKSRSHSSTNQLQAKGIQTVRQPSIASSNQETSLQFSTVQASTHVNGKNGSPIQGSNVAKCLFNQPILSPPTNSSCPKTPPRAIRASPVKQMAYYSVERSQCISSSSPIKTNLKRVSKRDHVKGRLDFDGSENTEMGSGKPIPCGTMSASDSEKEGEMFDLDLSNLDALGVDFSLCELLLDFDLDGEGTNYYSQPAMDSSSSPYSLSGSPHTSENVNTGANQILLEKDMNTPGPDSVTSLKLMTKCNNILSPVKSHRSSLDQENLSARN